MKKQFLLAFFLTIGVLIGGCSSDDNNEPEIIESEITQSEVYGCMDETASNYNSEATVDDGSCVYPISGCMDETASNYNSKATVDDGSCVYLPKVTIIEPHNQKVFYQEDHGNWVDVTFTWEVKNIEDGFTSKICFDKGVNPYDGHVEFCKELGENVTSYMHRFHYDYWYRSSWGVIVTDKNGIEYNAQSYEFFISGIGENIKYFSGVNLPWYNYGWDVGRNPWGGAHDGFSNNPQRLKDDFSFLSEHEVKTVRVFVFCDLRSGLIYDSTGKPIAFDEYVMDDFSALVLAAKESDRKLIPVLFDYMMADGVSREGNTPVGEHPDLITNPEKRQALMNLLSQFITSFDSEQIYAWEVMNEPSLASAVTSDELKVFVKEVVDLIHAQSKNDVTLGCINRGELDKWTDVGLDIYQFHYYDYMEDEFPFNFQRSNLNLDKRVLIGEVEPTDVTSKLDTMLSNGYRGVLFWSLNSDYDFRSKADEYLQWVNAH